MASDPELGSIVNITVTFLHTLSRPTVSNSWFVDYRTILHVIFCSLPKSRIAYLPTRPSEAHQLLHHLQWAVRIVLLTLSCLVHVPPLNSVNEAKLRFLKKLAFINYRNSLLHKLKEFQILEQPFQLLSTPFATEPDRVAEETQVGLMEVHCDTILKQKRKSGFLFNKFMLMAHSFSIFLIYY